MATIRCIYCGHMFTGKLPINCPRCDANLSVNVDGDLRELARAMHNNGVAITVSLRPRTKKTGMSFEARRLAYTAAASNLAKGGVDILAHIARDDLHAAKTSARWLKETAEELRGLLEEELEVRKEETKCHPQKTSSQKQDDEDSSTEEETP